MTPVFRLLLAGILAAGVIPAARAAQALPVAVPHRTNAVDFAREIQPMFRASCLACHNRSTAEAGLVLESPADIRKGGESGPAVVPGRAADSLLFNVAIHAEKPVMPPKKNKAGAEPLNPNQLGLLQLWINQGATGSVDVASTPVRWQPVAPVWLPIYSVAVSPDGQFAAAGRGSQVVLYHLPTTQAVTRLSDPALEREFKRPGLADRDLIQSLDFSPDGSLVAAGGYRTVRFWRRPVATPFIPAASQSWPTNPPLAAVAAGYSAVASGAVVRLERPADKRLVAELKGERHTAEALAGLELRLAFSRDEIGRRKAGVDDLVKQRNEQTNAVSKAVAARDKSAQSLTEKQAAARKAGETQAAAATEARSASNALARATADRVAAATAAGAATNSVAARRVAATNALAAMLKAHAAGMGTNELAASRATAEEQLKSAVAAEVKAREALAAAVRVETEATKKRDDAAKKLADAAKPATNAVAAVKIAEGVLEGANHALQLGTNELLRLDRALPAARDALAAAEKTVKDTDSARARAEQDARAAMRPFKAVALSTNLNLVAAADDLGRVHLWSLINGLPVETLRGFTGSVARVAFSGDGVVLQGTNGALAGWRLPRDWPLVRQIGTGDETSALEDRVLTVRFSPDGSLLATGGGVPSRSGELKLWRVSDGTLLRTITNAHSDTIFAVDFSPDGRLLASAGADRFARVWDVTNGALVKVFEGHTHHVVGVSWRRDGRVMATAGADRVVKIWDVTTGTQKKSTTAAAKELTGVQFLGIGGELLASRGDAIVRRFKEDGATVNDLPGATQYMTCVAATPDARWLLAAGHDSIVRVWNAKGEPWASFSP